MLGISMRNFSSSLGYICHPMRALWYYHQWISLLYFKVIRITVTPPSDFSVLENFRRKTHCRKSRTKPDVKQLFYYQINMMSKFTRIEPPGSLRLWKHSRSITGIVQNRRYRRTQGNAANDSLTQGTIDRAVKEFLKRLTAYVVAKGERFYYSY